jgi:LPXTG-site transpeptidase (sortase) family protein
MKNIGGKAYAALIVVGVALASTGIWFGFLSGYLKSTNDVERAQQLFVSQSPAPTSVETTMAPEPPQLVEGVPKRGQTFAIMRIPSLGSDWVRTISEGTTLGILDRLGVGHYEKTEFPGEPGNFAVAGHSGNRWTPFAKYQKIKTGDLIQIETFDTNYTYEVIETVTVNDTDVKTVYENPSLKSDTDGKSWLTITTCVTDGPKDKRIAIFAELVSGVTKE